MANINPQWDQFANWLVTTNDQRIRLGLPLNQVQYANEKNISDRQLRRWKSNPIFQALLEQKKLETNPNAILNTEDIKNTNINPSPENPDNPEDEYLQIKGALVRGALTGDPKYLDLYFKTYGKDFVAEEAAARTSDLAGLEMKELIINGILELGFDYVVEFLKENGYTISEDIQNG